MYPRNMICFRYIIVNTLHKVDKEDDDAAAAADDDDDDDDDDNNNNYNNNNNERERKRKNHSLEPRDQNRGRELKTKINVWQII